MSESAYRLHVPVDRGRGPVYVLLHGINSTGNDWDTVVTAMGFDRRCIAVDELGYGRSPKPLDIEYTADDHVAALRRTLRELGVDGPFTLVGYSMGGPIALHYAAMHPDEVKRLVLISAPFFLRADEIGAESYAKAVFQTEGSRRALELATSERFASSSAFDSLTAADRHVIQDFINSTDIDTDWQVLRKNVRNVIGWEGFSAALERVAAPTTFMIGAHDTFIVQSQIETLRRRYKPDMEVRVLADLKADHMLLENVPALIADEIVRWEDRRLAVALDRGEGDILVLLHGIENDGSFWNAAGAALSASHRVVSIDLLGFGHSPKPLDVGYTVDDHVESIRLTLESLLGEGARFTLVGHSIGAIIAAGYARRHPSRVERLVLFSPPVSGRGASAGSAAKDRARAAFVSSFGALRERGSRLARKRVVVNALGRRRLDRYEPSLRSLHGVVEREELAEDLLAVEPLPVTVVHGLRDPFVVPEYAAELGALRASIHVITIDAGHDIATSRPVEAVAAIDPVLDPVEVARRVEKAKTDRKQRPPTRGIRGAFDADALLTGARGVVYLAFGTGLAVAPVQGDLGLLRLAFAIFVLTRSITTITGLFTTRSIRQERLASAATGLTGVAVGAFLLSAPEIGRDILFVSVAGYLALSGAVDLFAAVMTLHADARRRRLLGEGIALLAAAGLLVAGSVVVARLVVAFITVASVAAGITLVTYALTMRRTGRALGQTSI